MVKPAIFLSNRYLIDPVGEEDQRHEHNQCGVGQSDARHWKSKVVPAIYDIVVFLIDIDSLETKAIRKNHIQVSCHWGRKVPVDSISHILYTDNIPNHWGPLFSFPFFTAMNILSILLGIIAIKGVISGAIPSPPPSAANNNPNNRPNVELLELRRFRLTKCQQCLDNCARMDVCKRKKERNKPTNHPFPPYFCPTTKMYIIS